MSKEKALRIINSAAVFFFAVLVFWLPISKAAVESLYGFILFCFILRAVLAWPSWQDFKGFFKDKINLSLLIFFAAMGLSLFAAGPLWKKSFIAWTCKWGEYISLFYFGRIFLKKKHIKILLLVMAISAFFVCIEGVYQRKTGVGFMRGRELVESYGLIGTTATFKHYNNFGSYLTVLFFLTTGLFFHKQRLKDRSPLLILMLFLLFNLFLTFSRGAWLAFIFTIVISLVFFGNKKYKILVGSFLSLFLVVIFLIPVLCQRFYLMLAGGDSGRFDVWKIAFTLFKQSPLLGKGVGLFMDYFKELIPKPSNVEVQYAHNCYLQMLTETGLIAFLPFLWFIGELLLRAYRKLAKNINFLFIGIFLAILVLLTHAFFDTHFYSLKLSVLFWLLASFLAVYIQDPGPER